MNPEAPKQEMIVVPPFDREEMLTTEPQAIIEAIPGFPPKDLVDAELAGAAKRLMQEPSRGAVEVPMPPSPQKVVGWNGDVRKA